MWKQILISLYIGFVTYCYVSASECDHSSAYICMRDASKKVRWLFKPTMNCSTWYNCIAQYNCTPEELNMLSPTHCSAIEKCSYQEWFLADQCYDQQRNCSGLHSCINQLTCPALDDWVQFKYCKDGDEKYCNAAVRRHVVSPCLYNPENIGNCSAQYGCLTKSGQNCEKVLDIQMELPAECRDSNAGDVGDGGGVSDGGGVGDGAKTVPSSFLLTMGISIAVIYHML